MNSKQLKRNKEQWFNYQNGNKIIVPYFFVTVFVYIFIIYRACKVNDASGVTGIQGFLSSLTIRRSIACLSLIPYKYIVEF